MQSLHKTQSAPEGANKLKSADGRDDGWYEASIQDASPPLTRLQAELLAEKLGSMGLEAFLMRVLLWQALAAVAVAALAWLVSFSVVVAGSVFYGAICAVLPTALVARMVIKRIRPGVLKHSGDKLVGLLVLELVKVVFTVCLLLAAHFVLESPHWVAIVIGFAVTLKVYWVVALVSLKQTGRSKKIGKNE